MHHSCGQEVVNHAGTGTTPPSRCQQACLYRQWDVHRKENQQLEATPVVSKKSLSFVQLQTTLLVMEIYKILKEKMKLNQTKLKRLKENK